MTIEQRVKMLTRDANRTAGEIETLKGTMNDSFNGLAGRFDALEERLTQLEADVRQILELLQQKS